MAWYIEYITPIPGAKTFIEQDAAAAKPADKAGLLEPAPTCSRKPPITESSNAAETKQWNDIFNAVIIA